MKFLRIWIQVSFRNRRLVKPHFIFGRMSVHRGIQRIVIFLVKAVWLRIFWHIHYDACIFIVLWWQKLFGVFIFGRMSVHRGIQRIVIFLVKAVWLRIFWHIHYDACIFIVLWRQKLFAVFIFGRMSLRQGRSTELFGKGCKIIEKLVAKLLMKIFKSVRLECSVQMTLAFAIDFSEIFCSAVQHFVILLP